MGCYCASREDQFAKTNPARGCSALQRRIRISARAARWSPNKATEVGPNFTRHCSVLRAPCIVTSVLRPICLATATILTSRPSALRRLTTSKPLVPFQNTCRLPRGPLVNVYLWSLRWLISRSLGRLNTPSPFSSQPEHLLQPWPIRRRSRRFVNNQIVIAIVEAYT